MVGFDDSTNDEDADDFGTANALYLVKDKIRSDCIIVSCDLITNINLNLLANSYRINNASFLMLLYDISEQNFELPVPGTKEKYSPGIWIVHRFLFETNKQETLVTVSLTNDIHEIFLNFLVFKNIHELVDTLKVLRFKHSIQKDQQL